MVAQIAINCCICSQRCHSNTDHSISKTRCLMWRQVIKDLRSSSSSSLSIHIQIRTLYQLGICPKIINRLIITLLNLEWITTVVAIHQLLCQVQTSPGQLRAHQLDSDGVRSRRHTTIIQLQQITPQPITLGLSIQVGRLSWLRGCLDYNLKVVPKVSKRRVRWFQASQLVSRRMWPTWSLLQVPSRISNLKSTLLGTRNLVTWV